MDNQVRFDFRELMSIPELLWLCKYKRNVGAYDENGNWKGVITYGTTKVIMQAAGEDELNMLPIGERQNDVRIIVSKIELFMSEDNHKADILTIGKEVFKVTAFKPIPWNLFYYLATKINRDDKEEDGVNQY